MPGKIWLPKILFDFFPTFNNEKVMPDISEPQKNTLPIKSLDKVSSKELDEMPFKEFQNTIDAPANAPKNFIRPLSKPQFLHS